MSNVKLLSSAVFAVVGVFVMGSAFGAQGQSAESVNNLSQSSSIAVNPSAPVVSSYQLEMASQNGIYAGGDVANMWEDWQNSPVAATGKNNQTATVFDGYLGYQYTKNYAAEMGFYYLPAVKGAKLSDNGGATGEIKSYLVDFELKLIQPVYHHLSLFAKGGVAYRSFTLNGDASLYSPIFGTGAEFVLNPNISFDFAYNYIAGSGSLNAASIKTVPEVNMLMLGVKYNFSG